MLYSNENTGIKEEKFLFSRIILLLQMVFFGGWNGAQLLLQPQDLSIFIADRMWLDNYFFTMSYSWQNIPLLTTLLLAVAVIWIYISITIDQEIVNSYKKKDNINVIPYKDKDNINVFLTFITLFIWMLAFLIIYLLPLWDLNFLTNLFYDITGLNKFQEPIYILVILVTCSITMIIRLQLLFFYSGGNEQKAVKQFFSSLVLMKSYYFKTWLVNLLMITFSLLIYKHALINIFILIRNTLPNIFLINFPLIVNRGDVLVSIPSFILLFMLSNLLFSPIVIFIHKALINSQYNFFKQQYIKNKNKKDIDENILNQYNS